MQKSVIITADSTVDLSRELVKRFEIHIIPLTVIVGEESYLDGIDFTPADMYKRYHADGTVDEEPDAWAEFNRIMDLVNSAMTGENPEEAIRELRLPGSWRACTLWTAVCSPPARACW